MLEKEIERKVIKEAKKQGWVCFKFVSPSNKGVPDRILFRHGKTLLIEFKKPGGELSPIQKRRIQQIQNQWITVRVIDNLMDGYNAVA